MGGASMAERLERWAFSNSDSPHPLPPPPSSSPDCLLDFFTVAPTSNLQPRL